MAPVDLERGSKNGGGNTNNRSLTPYYVDTSEKKWTSWLVPMFVLANVAVFIIAMYVNNCPRDNIGFQGKCVARFLGRLSFQPLRENPLFGPSSTTLEKIGALEWDKVVHKHQGWRLVTCMWLHAGVIHLLANMLSLVFIGIRLEQQFGFLRVGVIYLISGLGGSILSALFIQKNISVGASGALFGLLGAMLSELLTNWTIYSNKIAALVTLLVIIAINLAIGILPHVDNFAHIGGFLAGFLLGFVFLVRPQFGWVKSRHLPRTTSNKMPQEGNFKFHQYQVVGRHLPTEHDPNPTVYRMKVWAQDAVRAKSKFWYFLRKLRRVKKANGQIIAVNEIFERKPTTVKNFGIWVRYQSRTGYHNMYKEYRDTTLNGAVDQMYSEMASRHRVRFPCIQIIKTATVPASACKRANTLQFHDSKIKFPLTRRMARPSAPEFRSLYKATRPNVAMV